MFGLGCITRRRPDAQAAIAHAGPGYHGSHCGWNVQTNFVQELRKKDKARAGIEAEEQRQCCWPKYGNIFTRETKLARPIPAKTPRQPAAEIWEAFSKFSRLRNSSTILRAGENPRMNLSCRN